MCRKFLASPVLALVFGLLIPLSFLSDPRSHNCLLVTYFIHESRTHLLPHFSLCSAMVGRMLRHLVCALQVPYPRRPLSSRQSRLAGHPANRTFPENINEPSCSCIFFLYFLMEKAELSEFRGPESFRCSLNGVPDLKAQRTS